jgi:hypothetical protein
VGAWKAMRGSRSRYSSAARHVCEELGTEKYVEYCFAFFLVLQALYRMWEVFGGFWTGIDEVAEAQHCDFRKGKELGFEKRRA